MGAYCRIFEMEGVSLPPEKKLKLQSYRFGSPSEASPSPTSEGVTGRNKASSKPKRFNTDKCTAWGTKVFRDWANERNARTPLEDRVPDDLLDRTFSTDQDMALLNHWFAKFVTEARSREGKPYPPNTIKGLLAAILRHLRSLDPDVPNFMSAKDPRFSELQNVIETTIEGLYKQGIGAVVKRTPLLVSPEEEEKLWSECILGVDTPLKLQRTVLFYVGKVLGIRGGSEHRALKPSQFFRYSSPDRYHVTMNNGSKVIAVNSSPGAGQRCPVYLLDQYLPRLPESALDRDIFYVKPKADFTSSQWYDPAPLGREKLRTMVKDMCAEAGLSENVIIRKGKEKASAAGTELLASVCMGQGVKSIPGVVTRFPGISAQLAGVCGSSSVVHMPHEISKAQQVISRSASFSVQSPVSQAGDQQISSVFTPPFSTNVARAASHQTIIGTGKQLQQVRSSPSVPAQLQTTSIQMPQASVARSVQIPPPCTLVASQTQLTQSLQSGSRVLIESRPLTPILPKFLSCRTQLNRYQIKPHYSSAELAGTNPSSNPVLQAPRVCPVEIPSIQKQPILQSQAQKTPLSEGIQTTAPVVEAQVMDTFHTPIHLTRVSNPSELQAASIQQQTSANITLPSITPTQEPSSDQTETPMPQNPSAQTTEASNQVTAATQTSDEQVSDVQTPGAAQISQASIAQIVQEAITQVLRSANIQVAQSQDAHASSPQMHQGQSQLQSTSQQPQAASSQQQPLQNPLAQVLQNSGGQPPQILLCPVIILKQ